MAERTTEATSRVLSDITLLAEGLAFPEGPVALPDGSVLLTEIDRGTVTRVSPEADIEVVAECGGGPNGAAVGPDGALYVCNNGGRWASGKWDGGWIERIDLASGDIELLYRECDGRRLSGPNDLVFETSGWFWFSDTGKFRGRQRDVGSIYYASPAGDAITEVVHPAETPNGIGLSPDQRTLYYAETITGRLRKRAIVGPGRVEEGSDRDPATLVCGLPGYQLLDSLALDRNGSVCIATLRPGCITVVDPNDGEVTQYALPPQFEGGTPTNICFGG
ncbi:MAG TPA: SMP-30/gluconolactonase/LRE family protein, partial [Acidimicrobiales bacterium]|nr:SMP-30/gluconolactonase/LRE family protein [Acidimicrobiales bacterium]